MRKGISLDLDKIRVDDFEEVFSPYFNIPFNLVLIKSSSFRTSQFIDREEDGRAPHSLAIS